jgi:N-acetylmuramoyl-L-alanine amidase
MARQVVIKPGVNQRSIGICLVGTDRFTPAQWTALKQLVATLKAQFPGCDVLGHRDLSPDLNHDGKIEPSEFVKTCPGFDVKKWMAYGEPEAEHVLQGATA